MSITPVDVKNMNGIRMLIFADINNRKNVRVFSINVVEIKKLRRRKIKDGNMRNKIGIRTLGYFITLLIRCL
jgi:hypothetical protein